MTYKYFMLKQIDNEIVVIANKEPKPVLSDFIADEHQENMLLAAMNVWLRNHETFKPYDEEQLQLIAEASLLNYKQLNEGIEITCCEIREVEGIILDGEVYIEPQKFAFYKPEEQKEESQTKNNDILIWTDVINILIQETDPSSALERLRNQFTITRKSK
jgi:hypothetical protein